MGYRPLSASYVSQFQELLPRVRGYEINGTPERYGWDYLSGVTELENIHTLGPR